MAGVENQETWRALLLEKVSEALADRERDRESVLYFE